MVGRRVVSTYARCAVSQSPQYFKTYIYIYIYTYIYIHLRLKTYLPQHLCWFAVTLKPQNLYTPTLLPDVLVRNHLVLIKRSFMGFGGSGVGFRVLS